jgi:hypothetical protein
VLGTNLKVHAWLRDYHNELLGFLRAVLKTIDHFAERLLNHQRLDPKTREFVTSLKRQVTGYLERRAMSTPE